MNKSTFLANTATVMQLQREKHQKSLHEVKMSKFLVNVELMKLLQMDHSQKFMRESFTLANIAAIK